MTLSPTERQRARELADAATPGPWRVLEGAHTLIARLPFQGNVPPENHFLARVYNGGRTRADAEFIAEARALVPRLLAALEEAEAEIAALRQLAKNRANEPAKWRDAVLALAGYGDEETRSEYHADTEEAA